LTRNSGLRTCVLLGAVAVITAPVPARSASRNGLPAVAGLDHIPIAVRDLDAAGARYRALGFSLKAGTAHDNGIRNVHVKFAVGTELELITAPAARDGLTMRYRRLLAKGDGPAFLALYAPALDPVAERLDGAKVLYRREERFLDVLHPDAISYIFFGPRNASPTDRPEHFAHANTAESLMAVWLAGADLSREREMLQALYVPIERRTVDAPAAVAADVAVLPQGRIVLLPSKYMILEGRPVVGATLKVRSLAAARAFFARTPWAGAVVSNGSSVFLPPAVTHGLWLEFRES